MSDIDRDAPPLRVLHVGKFFPPHPGGMETYLRDLMNVQKRQGLSVMALVHASKRGIFDREESVDALDGTTYQVMRSARWFNLGFVPISPGFILSALKAIKRFKPNVIHIHHPNSSAMWLLLLPAARRVPWVAHWQSDIETPSSSNLIRFLYRIYRPIEQAILRKTARIIATSPPYLESSTALASHRTKCEVIPLGLDLVRLPKADGVSGVDRPKNPLILFVGRLATYKGLHNLVEALGDLEGAHCWIVGDGPLRSPLERAIQKLQLNDRITLVGAVSEADKWRLYKTCDVLVLPSVEKTESFGMVLLEATHFQRPVVVTDAAGSGMMWVAEHLPASRIAKANAPASLAQQLAASLRASSRKSPPEISARHSRFDLVRQSQQISGQYQVILMSAPDHVGSGF